MNIRSTSLYTVDAFPIYSSIHRWGIPSIGSAKELIPMTEPIALLEPTFSAAMTAIEDAADLSAGIKRHWVCSLRQIAKWLDRPVEVTPARWTAIRLPVGQLHHARVGVTAKTVANHKSNVAAALRWFGKEHNVPSRGVALSAEWAVLRDVIVDRGRRDRKSTR